MKTIIAILMIFILSLAITGCSKDQAATVSSATTSTAKASISQTNSPVTASIGNATSTTDFTINYSAVDLDSSTTSTGMTYIKLENNTITVNGRGAAVNGSVVTITTAGLFSISGTLNDGQIIVNAGDQDNVKLVFNEASITCSNSAPIYVKSADKVVITLAAGTENIINDGSSYILDDSASGEPNAAIFSKSDLTINGNGSLTVNGNYNHGIASKDDLKIISGTISVTAVNEGIQGRDSVVVRDGTITINAGGDGIQSTNDVDANKGYIAFEGGTLKITAGADGIQAATSLDISGGDFKISTGGGSAEGISSTIASAKGLKAIKSLTVSGGTFNIDSADDSVHSNGSIVIQGGNLTFASGDDGIHADSSIQIDGGAINITKSYEGIESEVITVNNGTIHLVSSDDGFNAAGGMDGSSINGRPGQNQFTGSGNNQLIINGGYVFVNAGGDGIDSNGTITMTDGTVIINGPTNNGNGALDHMSFKMTGGFLVAVGSSGMAQATSTTSTQYAIMFNFSSTQSASTLIHIESADGKNILTFNPAKTYQSVVICSPDIANGVTYNIFTGGSSTGTAEDGLYSGGTYTAGTKIDSLTVSSVVTTGGSAGGGFVGGVPPGGRVR